MKNIIKSLLATLLIGVVYYYIALPPINLQSTEFYASILFICVIYYAIYEALSFNLFKVNVKKDTKKLYPLAALPAIIVVILVINMFYSPLFQSSKYANRITINENNDFIKDIPQVDFNKLPLLDKSSSQKLGDRVMGQMSDMVSQYNVSDLYTQINYNNSILRVTPLEYASVIKWFTNKKEGVKGYITVDSVTGEANLIRLEKGMKYLPSAMFNKNLYRHLRFQYPTDIFGKTSFEIDNEGHPYWIVQVMKYSAVELREDVKEIIVLDPVTGEGTKYKVEEVPTWIDMVYNAELIISQVDDWGTYKQGYFNSIFGQKNVVNTTDGYNYLAMNDDIYLYTGLTSIVNDESNLGFILTNLRTKETNFYSVPGAEEYSAMASAEGSVQQMKYKSTFPLLINLDNKPTYLVSLKDSAGLVKMYGFIDVADYQKVVVTDSSKGIEQAAKNYLGKEVEIDDKTELSTKKIEIRTITNAVVNGTTIYYLTDTNDQKYKVSINVSDELPFLKKGDNITISYIKESNITDIKKISK